MPTGAELWRQRLLKALKLDDESEGIDGARLDQLASELLPVFTDQDGLMVGLAADGISGVKVVVHGGDPNVPRPLNAPIVYWIGSVTPLNGLSRDLWVNE